LGTVHKVRCISIVGKVAQSHGILKLVIYYFNKGTNPINQVFTKMWGNQRFFFNHNVNKIYDSNTGDWATADVALTGITVNYGTDSSTASYYQLHTSTGILSLFTTPAGTNGDIYVLYILL